MPNLFRKLSSQNLGRPIRSLLFFILLFLIILWIDPKLVYYGEGKFTTHIIYFPGIRTFANLLPYPGEAVRCLTDKLPIYYHYSWMGALIITMTAWLLCLGTDKFITTVSGSGLRALRFVPGIFLLLQYGRYYHYLDDSLSLLFGLLFLYLYMRIPLRSAFLRFVLFLVFSAVMYPVAVKSYLLFVVLCGIFEFFKRRHRILGLLCFFSALLVPYVAGTFIFDLNPIDTYRYMLFFGLEADRNKTILAIGLFLFFYIAGFGCAFWQLFTQKRESKQGKPGDAQKLLEYYRKSKIKWPLETVALIVLTAVAFLSTWDHISKKHRRIDYLADHKMWAELLHEARQLPPQYWDMFDCHDVNRALYHTGRLPYEMFSYPQHYSSLLLIPKEKKLEGQLQIRSYSKRAGTLYELGCINFAEHHAHEALELTNYNPSSLKLLALINIIKGQTDTARVFLRNLSKNFLYRNWAKQYLTRLEADPLLSTDQEIQRMRSLMPTEESIERSGLVALQEAFSREKRNKMTFEYMMAFCLLTGQYAPMAHSIKYMDDLDYPKGQIPRHYEEAILLYKHLTGRQPDLHGRQINVNTVRRFENFALQHRDTHDPEVFAKVFEKDFGDTYYYYHYYILPMLTE